MAPSLSSFRRLLQKHADLFDARGDVFVARAPGRLDVMGGIADYSGSVVLEGTLARGAFCAVQRARGKRVQLRSHGVRKEGLAPEASFAISDLPASYEESEAFFARDAVARWSGYLGGHLVTLCNEGVISAPCGLNILLHSNVPLGAGVASSAAIEVACMEALCAALGVELEGIQLARLCQITENRVVGAPCGIMDQVTCCLGETDELLALECRPHDVRGLVGLPPDVRVLGINSNVKHAVGGSKYARARVGAFMGLKIINELGRGDAGEYLCNLTPERFRAAYHPQLPATMSGSQFLAEHGSTDDPVTTIDPDETYSVRACATHPIYENARVRRFGELLGEGDESALVEAGKLMYASHWSYGKLCGLGARETDVIVRLVRERGPGRGLYGAKITGGGSGGTVAILARGDVDEALSEILEEYHDETDLQGELLTGSSPGSRAFGVHVG